MVYADIEKYLASIPQFVPGRPDYAYGVDRALFLLEKLGRPDRELKVIHVAGTNGKGSVCAYMDELLRSAGEKTGLFSSPHLLCIRERIVYDGEMISEKDFEKYFNIVFDLLEKVKKEDPDFGIAYFEFLFLMAVLYYRDREADICIFETGLGGRLDAVNVFETPLISVITQIGLDHTAILGDTLESIAKEKCGIIKPGVPVLCIEPDDHEVKRIIEATAKKNNCQLIFTSKREISQVSLNSEKVDFLLQNRYYRNVNVSLRTPAVFAAEDAALALTAFAFLCSEGKKTFGIRGCKDHTAFVPSLFNVVREGRMEQIMPGVFADGAHNPQAIEAFIRSVEKMMTGGDNYLLFSAVKDKNFEEMVRILCSSKVFRHFTVCTIDSDRAAAAESIGEVFRKYTDSPVEVFSDTQEAFLAALRLKGDDDMLFCAGSLYLAAEIRQLAKKGSAGM